MPGLVMDLVDEAPVRLGMKARPSEPLRARTRAYLWLTLIYWLSNYVVMTLGAVLAGSRSVLAISAVRALLVGFGLVLCFLIHRALERWAGPSFRSRAILAAVLAPIAAETYAWAVYFGLGLVDPPRVTGTFNWGVVISTLSFWTWFFLGWAGLYLALGYSFDAQSERLRSSELRAHAQAAQLRALYNQVNPHFLFNSLNSISALIVEQRNADADRMVGKIATFFRRSLSIDPFEDIPLSQEIDLQRAYLEIEQLRYPDLVLDIDCPPALANAAVPALILQPLIENAVKYGVAGSTPPAHIAITARTEGDDLVIAVSDSGKGSAAAVSPGAGVGLKNVRERLAQRFGENQSVLAGRVADGFICTITLPLRNLS
jgi:signal transduction histidine kinase